jgi:hypothetical protein
MAAATKASAEPIMRMLQTTVSREPRKLNCLVFLPGADLNEIPGHIEDAEEGDLHVHAQRREPVRHPPAEP